MKGKSAVLKVLLINPLCRRAVEIPLGLGYIASVLMKSGHKVEVLDINALELSQDKVIEAIKNINFDIVGIGGLTSTYKYVKWLSSGIKKIKPSIPIIAGNMVSTAIPEILLKNTDVDIAVIDEGEDTCRELVEALSQSKNIESVNGIWFKKDGQIVKTGPRQRIENLDLLPFPAWDLFPLDVYLRSTIHVDYGLKSMSMSTVRGCPYTCFYCSRPFGRKVYARSAKSMVDEIRELKNRYGVQYIGFADDLFLFNENRIMEFCDLMIKENLGVKWGGSGRVNIVNENLLSRMKKADCICLDYGFESGSQKILDIMRKNVTVKQAEDAVRMTRKAKIKVMGSFIFGSPGETKETIKETIDFIKRADLPVYRFFYATPFPKTDMYEMAKKMDRLPLDEEKYIESLGEMRTTFLVNLTDFRDEELIRLKNLSEFTVKRNMGIRPRFELFTINCFRIFLDIRLNFVKNGAIKTFIYIFTKILNKLNFMKK